MTTTKNSTVLWSIHLLIVVCFFNPLAYSKIIYVDEDAIGINDGSDWSNAYVYLQDALADANDAQKPVVIRVAQGTYTPDCGTGYVRGDKQAKFLLKSGITIKGGFAGVGNNDPNAWDYQVYETILSGDLTGNDERLLSNFVENSDHVIWCIEGDASAVLDGFTITGGYATDRIGGGLLNYKANPTVRRCVFFDNYASQGGGMANRFSNPLISECTFSGNLVRYGGGGMYNTDQSHPIIQSCILYDNRSTILGGGGMYCGDSNPTVTNCLFVDNRAPFGGGMYNVAANPTITNCTFSNNQANAWGGGIQNDAGANPVVANCILWGNAPDQMTTFGSLAAHVTYSNVQGGHTGEGNINSDPLFVETANSDYHLQAGSPCIDVGDNVAIPAGVIVDLDGNPRIINGIVDMGAYEAVEEVSDVEEFETGDFSKFPWEHSGDETWAVTSRRKHSGVYSAESGSIGDDEYTTLEVTCDCVSGDISFYWRVSSESSYDCLKFYIDGVEKDESSGEQDWTEVSFPVTPGTRTFEWTYSKDGSISEGDDRAWVDDIVFPMPPTGVVDTTEEFIVVEDFEDYNDYPPHQIFETWIDGYGQSNNGSIVGYEIPPICEVNIVHGGQQSMPFFYSNTGGAPYSEAKRTFSPGQNWTRAGVRILVLYFYGTGGNTGRLYAKVNGRKVVYDGDVADITKTRWTQWNIELAPLGVNLRNVRELSIGIDGNGASGTLYFDDIRLYHRPPEAVPYKYVYEGDAAIAGPADSFDSLDGTWDHNNGSDEWDGTGPGVGHPGGTAALTEDGVTFLRIQDSGDPRDYGMNDPGSNRKVYFIRPIDIGLNGARLEFRVRVATSPPLDDQYPNGGGGIVPWPAGGIGYEIRDHGKGMFGISDGVGIISFSLAKAGEPGFEDVTTDVLVMNNLVGGIPSANVDTGDTARARNMIAVADVTQWNTFTIDIAAGGAGTHVVFVSINDGPAESFEVTVGDGAEVGAGYITIGSSGTGGITAFDLDYIMVGSTPYL